MLAWCFLTFWTAKTVGGWKENVPEPLCLSLSTSRQYIRAAAAKALGKEYDAVEGNVI